MLEDFTILVAQYITEGGRERERGKDGLGFYTSPSFQIHDLLVIKKILLLDEDSNEIEQCAVDSIKMLY